MTNETKITCPNCSQEIDVNNVIAHQLEEQYKKKFNAQVSEEKKKFQDEFDKLEKQKQEVEKQRLEQEKLIAERVNRQIKSERATLEKELKSKIEGEQTERIELIEKELKEKSEQVRELNRTKAEIEKIKREKEELKESLEAENAKKLNQQIAQEKERIRKIEQENFIASLKPGSKYLGIIKKTQGFGVFICFGQAVGLLHINNIINEHSKLSNSSKKVFFKKFEKVFHKGLEIEVIIDNFISLTWDKTLEQNQKLCNEIYDIYKTLDIN